MYDGVIAAIIHVPDFAINPSERLRKNWIAQCGSGGFQACEAIFDLWLHASETHAQLPLTRGQDINGKGSAFSDDVMREEFFIKRDKYEWRV
jgi:hypothetical protein